MSSAVSLTFAFVLILIQADPSSKTTESYARNAASLKGIPHLFFGSFLNNKLKFILSILTKSGAQSG